MITATRASSYTTVRVGPMAQLLMSENPYLPSLLIVWHSRTGAARQLAEAGGAGAQDVLRELEAEGKLNVVLRRASEATIDDVLSAQGFLFCAPENLGSLTGEMKEFFDRHYYAALDRLNGRPYAVAIAAGSDGQGAARQVERICTGWRLQAVAPVYITNTDAQTPEAILAEKHLDAAQCEPARTLGGTLAALLV
jgi:Multimeric flavodoxin WrbA